MVPAEVFVPYCQEPVPDESSSHPHILVL